MLKFSFVSLSYLSEMAMNLCIKENSSNSSYLAKFQSDQNCGCISCIRRCCKPGFIYRQGYCLGSSSDVLDISLYVNKTNFVNVLQDNYENFIVGVPKCKMFRLNYPKQEFYIQSSNKDVWIPEYNKFYNNSWYCLDEYKGFSAFLCFSGTFYSDLPVVEKIDVLDANITVDLSDTVGMYS